jgi:hypothetical protein
MPVYRGSKVGWFSVLCLFLTPAFAKDSKPILPVYILQARTVAVLIDPNAGVSLQDPNANQTAQKDVEAALQKWGRFEVVLNPEQADLVIFLRKGHGKLVEETTSDPRQNGRPGSVTQTPGAITIGAQRGIPPPQQGSIPGGQSEPGDARPQTEIGAVNDSFEVYQSRASDPNLDASGWRWDHKDGLHAHDVPAVDQFRKAIAEAEKQAAQQQAKHP